MLPPGDCYPGLGPACSSSYSSGSIHTEADTEWDYSEDRPHSVGGSDEICKKNTSLSNI